MKTSTPAMNKESTKADNADTGLPPPGLAEYILFPLFLLAFFGTLVLYDIILKFVTWCVPSAKEWGAYHFNNCVLYSLKVVGTKVKISGQEHLPDSGPCIIISNHQSMFDIPSIHVACRKLLPRFVAKVELGKGIPGVSTCLRLSGAALIDRSDANQALRELKRFGEFIKESKTSAVIFPEGTRARYHTPKPFKKRGTLALMKEIAPVWIVPVSVKNSWKLQARKFGPLPLGVQIQLHIHPPMYLDSVSEAGKILDMAEEKIKSLLIS
jgi:1-acyl-sn-glycerol-3-phosphate acyltransferase